MVKNALNKDLFREIKNTRARFLSIFLLVALSVAFLSGLRTTQPDMTKSADDYLDSTNLMDIRIVATLGLTEEDRIALSLLEGVNDAQGDWQVDALVSGAEATLVVKTISLSEDGINRPWLLEGRLPETATECIVEQSLLDELGLSIGDTLTLDTGTGDYADALAGDTYTVVGTCNSPLYISTQRGTTSLGTGSISAIVYLPRAAYTMDYYTDIYLTLEGALELNAYSDAYRELVEAFVDSIQDFAEQRAALRTQEVRGDAQTELEDARTQAQSELEDAQAELDDARTQLDEGWSDYQDGLDTLDTQAADGQAQIDQAENDLTEAYQTLVESEAEYKSGLSQLTAAQKQYQQGLAEYEQGLAQYESGYAQYQEGLAAYEEGLAQYQEGLEAYWQGYAQYQVGLEEFETLDTLYQAAMSAYDTALAQWEAAWAELQASANPDSDLLQTLLEQKQQLEDTVTEVITPLQQQMEDSRTELEEARAQLDDAWDQLQSASAQLEESRELLDETASALEDARVELAVAQVNLETAATTIATYQTTLAAARTQLDQGWTDYYNGIDSVTDAQSQLTTALEEARSQLDEALEELTQGEDDYADGLAEYQQAVEEVTVQLEDAQAEIDDIADCTWYVLDRSSNLGFAGYESDAENMGNLAAIFPLIFFLVAALVCLTTMTRMVEEQRITIGGLKAMGYSKAAIARKYVGYGLIASAGGSVLGLLVGCTALPWIIITCWQIMYSIPTVKFAFCPLIYIFSAGAAVLVIVGTVLSATLSALRASPAVLMRAKTPKAGKRVLLEHIPPLWRRLSFTQKVTVRNLFRYKKRFWMTIIGISGCTALIVTGFGLRDSIDNVLNIQYDQLNLYDATAVFDQEDQADLQALLEGNDLVSASTVVHQGTVDFESGTTISGYYMVFDDTQSITRFMVFRDRLTGQTIELSDDGIYIGEKLSELLDLQVGDTLVLSGDTRVTVTVAGIVEHHVYNYAYMTQACYESLYGQTAEHNLALICYTQDSTETENAVGSALLEAGVISSITQITAMRDSLNESFVVINYAVLVVIISAAALAFVVLFNLSNINITERKRELATLKVLGFRDREISDYVLRENVILTILGILLGLLLGKWLHAFLVKTVEVEMIMFAREAEPLSYLLAALLTALFAIVVNIIAGHALKKIDMVESLKSVE